MNALLLLFLSLNILTFILFGLDKYFALKNKRRISENTLHLLSILGGFLGAFWAMFLFKHKIKKFSFMLIQTAVFVFWSAVFVFSFFKQ